MRNAGSNKCILLCVKMLHNFGKHSFNTKPDLLIYTTRVYDVSKQYNICTFTKMSSYLRIYQTDKFQKYFFLFNTYLKTIQRTTIVKANIFYLLKKIFNLLLHNAT